MCCSLYNFFCFSSLLVKRGVSCAWSRRWRSETTRRSHWSWRNPPTEHQQKATNSSTNSRGWKQTNKQTGKHLFLWTEGRKKKVKDLMAAVSWWCHEEGGPLTDSLVTMAMVASTVLYSMSSMSGGGPVLGNTCEEGAWPLQPSGPSPTNPRADGKAASSERGGAEPLLVLEPASFSSAAAAAGV